MNTLKVINFWFILAIGMMLACKEDAIDPILPESSMFKPAEILNAATAAPSVLLPADAQNLYEKIEWKRADYGAKVSVDYVLEVDDNFDFSSPKNLALSSKDFSSITVEQINDAVLALGIPGFTKDTVAIRVKSTINSFTSTPLYSNVIKRIITNYQVSECGAYCTIGLIGSATAGGWNNDIDMRLADPLKIDKYTWTVTTYLGLGDVKFRASDAWTNNWGAASFPTGKGVQNGANITIPTAGYYKVVFNDNTGDYSFTALAVTAYTSVGIIGSATAGGWNTETAMTQDVNDPHVWTATITFTAGDAKFRANNAWTVNWGATSYPSGYGVGNGPNIPVKAGTYFVWFHDMTGQYFIMPTANAAPYLSLGIIGTATQGGWGTETGLTQNPSNPYLWSKVLTLTDGEAKFRADNAWAVNWGASTFPGGIGAQNGANIPVKGNTFFVTFNTGTGEYYFLR